MIQYIIAAGIGALLGSSGKKPKKMGHGGKTQGYNSRLDESLSMRHGAGRKKQQTRKDRRDESAAMERSMGRRKYASVGSMDKGRRTMEKGGEIKGGKTQGYNARLDESLAMRRGSKRTKKQGYKSRRHESEGMERSMGRRKYASVSTMDKGRRKMAQGGLAIHFDDDYTHKDEIENLLKYKTYMGDNEYLTDYGSSFYVYADDISPSGVRDVYNLIVDNGYDENVELEFFAKGGYVRPKNLALPERHYQTLADALDKVIDHYGKDAIKDYIERNGEQGRYAVYRQATNRIWMDDDNPNLRGDRFGIKHDPDWRTRTRMYTDKHFDSATKSILSQKLGKGRKRMALGGMAGRISPMEMQQIILDKTGKLLDPSTQVFANEAGALGYLYALFGDYYTKSMQKGGKTSSAEERAFAEYMEDYGVDREQAEEQFLGEFRNKEEWAAEYVDNLGGIEQFIDPERFLKVDKIGFREWAMNMADAMSSDLDDDELEDRAERHGLKFEYMEAEEMGGDAMKNFRREIEEKEYDEQYDYFMSEGESVEGVLDLLGNYGVQGIEDASDLYVVEVDYDEVADALEDDGVVFIEEDFKTFVFDPNMRRGGRTKCTSCNKNRMKKGGRTKSRKKVSDFDKLAMKVAARYRAEGKSNKEAMEIGRGTAAKVYRQQQAKGGAKRRKGRK
jgi:hypothetical protein